MATTKTDPKLALTANGAKKSKLYEGLTRDQLIQAYVGSSRVDLQACKLEYSIVSPK